MSDALPYADPTGDLAAALADKASAGTRDADLAAIWRAAAGAHRTAGGTLTNTHCIAALLAIRGGQDATEQLLANLHTPDPETTWEPHDTSTSETDLWDGR